MAEKVFVRPAPARQGGPKQVRNPQKPGSPFIPAEGEEVELDRVMRRRLRDGDLVRAPKPAARASSDSDKPQPAPAKAAEPTTSKSAASAGEKGGK